MDIHKLASLMVRDHTIAAKQLSDLARSNRAMAHTWRQVLDDTVLPVLPSAVPKEDGKIAAPTLDWLTGEFHA